MLTSAISHSHGIARRALRSGLRANMPGDFVIIMDNRRKRCLYERTVRSHVSSCKAFVRPIRIRVIALWLDELNCRGVCSICQRKSKIASGIAPSKARAAGCGGY